MKKAVGIILIVGAIVLAVLGYNSYSDSQSSLEIGDIELSAQDESSNAYIYYFVGTGICLIIGITALSGKKGG